MKKIYLGRDKKTEVMIMNAKEVLSFLKNKIVYHREINWYERWTPYKSKEENQAKEILSYFPIRGFTLPAHVKLAHYGGVGYSAKCLSHTTINGKKNIWDYPRYKITIRKTKNKIMYYVTKL